MRNRTDKNSTTQLDAREPQLVLRKNGQKLTAMRKHTELKSLDQSISTFEQMAVDDDKHSLFPLQHISSSGTM